MKSKITTFLFAIAMLFAIGVNAQIEHPIPATSNHWGGILEFSLAPGHTAITQITHPLIVVEGFEMGKILKPEERLGTASLEKFLERLRVLGANTPLRALLDGSTQSYDIIYVNYNNGTDWIERNARLVEDVIAYVNSNKAAVNGVMQANVVLGISMGGLCARHALRRMENILQDHQTRLLITWDSPHQGSNIPQGYQHLARHARDFYISTGSTVGVAEILVPLFANGVSPRRVLHISDEPASRQMLINRVGLNDAIDNNTHDTWQSDLNTIGHPEGFTGGFPFYRIAVSNGSECAQPQDFNAGDNLIHLQGDVMNVGMLSEIATRFALPLVGGILHQPGIAVLGSLPGRNQFKVTLNVHSKALNTGNQVYQCKVEYKKKILNIINVNVTLTDRSFNANASTLPYDYYPGGLINIKDHGFGCRFAFPELYPV